MLWLGLINCYRRSHDRSGGYSNGKTNRNNCILPVYPGCGCSSLCCDGALINIELTPGRRLAGRYEIKERIGQSGKGVVFQAYDKKNGEDITIKVLFPGLLKNEYARKRFLAEVKLSCRLYHPNIVNQFEVKSDGEYYFITMELLKGQNLRQIMDARVKSRKRFTEKEVVHIARTVSGGLTYAHLKTAHRDIKPENIWVDEKGNYKIMDFGVSSLVRANSTTQSGAPISTCYMAPEQLKDSPNINDRVDQYSLGLLMYELLTREIPANRNKSVRVKHRKISKNVASIIQKMLRVDPAYRYQKMDEIRSALTEIESNISVPKVNSKVLGTVATITVGVAVALYTIPSGRLSELWDNIRPMSADVEQQQFSEAIQLVNEANSLIRRLGKAKNNLEAKIRNGEINIQQLKDVQRKARSDTKKIEIEQLLGNARFDLTHNQQLRNLTNTILYDDSRLLRSKGMVQTALSHIEGEERLKATELLKPVRTDLKRDLQQFGTAEDYLWAHEKLGRTQLIWQRYNQSYELQQPADIDQRKPAITRAEQLAKRGQLEEAIKQIDRLIQGYQKDHKSDQQLVKDRNRHRVQQAKTLKLEKEWKSYLAKQGLKITAGQQGLLKRSKADERIQLTRQDFKGAEVTGQKLQQTLTGFYATSKATISNAIQKRNMEIARKENADYEKALAAGKKAILGKDYGQALKQYRKALSYNPKDKETGKQLQQAIDRSSSELLKIYAPGIELVKISAGSFKMGNLSRDGSGNEKPAHKVTIKGFNLMKHEVTFDQYDTYVAETGNIWQIDENWGRGNLPVINVSWINATDYAKWLSHTTGYRFRLPSEAEWEYAARSGTTTKYPWGNSASHEKANYGKDNCCFGLIKGSDQWITTSPVGSFPANRFGVNDMHGNVREWVQDCWNPSYNGAPKDGSARVNGDCNKHVLRGGSWKSTPGNLRSATRDGNGTDRRNNSLGFRLLQDP